MGQRANLPERVQSCWAGWTVNWHASRFEAQLDRTNGNLKFCTRMQSALLQELRKLLLSENTPRIGAEMMAKLGERLAGPRGLKEVSVNPAALHDAQLILPVELRTRLFDSAVASLDTG